MNASHLYLHVPFCSGKCGYCSFYSEYYSDDSVDAYIQAVATELDMRLALMDGAAPETIYFGGGTPSVLDPHHIEALLAVFLERISLVNLSEWSIEANPGTLCEEKLSLLCNAGVNRVSFGAQSFDDDLLRLIGRRHKVSDVVESLNLAREGGISNLGIDLIAGLPGVGKEAWNDALLKAIALDLKHISVYSLTLEVGTDMHSQSVAGELSFPDSDGVADMLEAAEHSLVLDGFKHYEVSNFAKAGFECRHNLSYWDGDDYLGIGPAASSRSGVERWTNAPDLQAYQDALNAGLLPPAEKIQHTLEEDVSERFAFVFRTDKGADLDAFCRKYGEPAVKLRDSWEKALKQLELDGFVYSEKARWAPTPWGMMHADGIARDLL